jgi:hypothetical protein
LPVWVVQTGEVPQLAVGDTWEGLAVRGTWWSFGPATGEDGVTDLPAHDGGSPHQEITGVVTLTREPHSMVVRAGTCQLLMEPKALTPLVDPGPDDPPAEQVFPDVVLPERGTRWSFEGVCTAMLDFEVDDVGCPGLRRDWTVRRLKVEHREYVPSPSYPGGSEPGRVLRVDTIERMLRWGDASRREHAIYLVDIEPA